MQSAPVSLDSSRLTGEAGAVDLLKWLASIEDPISRHANALINTHFVNSVGGIDPLISRACMGVCRALIGQAIPCRTNAAEVFPAVFLLGRGSCHDDLEHDTADLLRLYIRSGYFRMNNTVDAFGAMNYSTLYQPGTTNLEVAIRQGNALACTVLVEEGERTDLRPRTPMSKGKPYADMYALADDFWSDRVISTQMRAAAMRRRISEVTADAPPCPAPPRRRSNI